MDSTLSMSLRKRGEWLSLLTEYGDRKKLDEEHPKERKDQFEFLIVCTVF